MKPLISVILNAFAIAHAITDERVLLDKGDASIFWSVFIAYWLVIIGVNIWTSGVYHNNIDTIWKLGSELRDDPDRGPRWARRRSNAFIFANAAYTVVMIWIALKKV